MKASDIIGKASRKACIFTSSMTFKWINLITVSNKFTVRKRYLHVCLLDVLLLTLKVACAGCHGRNLEMRIIGANIEMTTFNHCIKRNHIQSDEKKNRC